MDERELVQRCLQGDYQAFDELVARYRERTYSLAVHLLADREWAEDMVQEVFLRAFQRLALFDPNKGTFASWLMTMTTRLCLNALKKRNAETHRQMAWEEEATEFEWWEEVPTPEEIWWATQQRLFVRRLLMTLPPPQRAALLLRYGEGMSLQEVAQALQVPVGTVKAWLFRGRETLRRKLKEAGLL